MIMDLEENSKINKDFDKNLIPDIVVDNIDEIFKT